jgi:hypothetical protein
MFLTWVFPLISSLLYPYSASIWVSKHLTLELLTPPCPESSPSSSPQNQWQLQPYDSHGQNSKLIPSSSLSFTCTYSINIIFKILKYFGTHGGMILGSPLNTRICRCSTNFYKMMKFYLHITYACPPVYFIHF